MQLFTESDIGLLLAADEALADAGADAHFVEDCGRIQEDFFRLKDAKQPTTEPEQQALKLLREAATVTA